MYTINSPTYFLQILHFTSNKVKSQPTASISSYLCHSLAPSSRLIHFPLPEHMLIHHPGDSYKVLEELAGSNGSSVTAVGYSNTSIKKWATSVGFNSLIPQC